MASKRQLKHHARFHAAVLRYLFPPSPPHSSAYQDAVDQSCEEVCFQAQLIKGAELFAEESYSYHEDDGVEAGKALLSRAQRKRLKLKKLKEEQSDAMPVKKFIGPSLPDELEKRRHEVLDRKSDCAPLQDHGTPEKCPTLLNMDNREDVHDVREDEFLSTTTEEKHVHIAGDIESVCTKIWEGKDGRDGVEPEPLSKAKRRRLAKKKFQDNLQRHPLAASSFTAEITGGDIVIKQIM